MRLIEQFKRELKLSNKSFFLFGPRATGKSTWLMEVLPKALRIDLLRSQLYLRYLKEPHLLREEVEATMPEWVVIDEIQKIPALIDEVHAMIFDFKGKVKFAMTGSSARKLKSKEVNLLAGRALTQKMFPLILDEIGKLKPLDFYLKFGTLPEVCKAQNQEEIIQYLYSYVETYLKEEIAQETKVRDLSSFSRFLQVAATLNGQVLNLSNVARDVGVARSTIQGHFQILIDTLLGTLIEAYRPKAKVKEVSSPKFYFFDTGVVTALKSQLNENLVGQEKGFLLETLFLNELQAHNSYSQLHGKIYYWRTVSGNEVDFIFKLGKTTLGFEIKSTKTWKKEFNFGLETLLEEQIINKAYGIYLGDTKLKSGNVLVLPFHEMDLKSLLI